MSAKASHPLHYNEKHHSENKVLRAVSLMFYILKWFEEKCGRTKCTVGGQQQGRRQNIFSQMFFLVVEPLRSAYPPPPDLSGQQGRRQNIFSQMFGERFHLDGYSHFLGEGGQAAFLGEDTID